MSQDCSKPRCHKIVRVEIIHENITGENKLIQMKSQAGYCEMDAEEVQYISVLVDGSLKIDESFVQFFQWSG